MAHSRSNARISGSLARQTSLGQSLRRRLAYAVGSGVIALGALFVLLQFHGTASGAVGPEGGGQSAPQVTVEKPMSRDLVEWDEFTGRFRAIEQVEVRARVSGYLEEVAFTDGQTVKEGDLLFRIDPRPFEAALAEAKANVASRESALTNARKENARGQELLRRGTISKANADVRLLAYQEAGAELQAAKAQEETARLDLEFSEIRAPISGRISDNFVSRGNLITGGAQGGTLLTSIVSTNPIYFEFTISEADHLRYLRLQQRGNRSIADATDAEGATKVYLHLLDENGYEHEGAVSFVDNRIDSSTGTMRGRAVFDNPDGTFVPGMFARLKVPASAEYRALLIPDSAVQTDQSEKFVWVVDGNDVVSRRDVELGPTAHGRRIVRSGLDADDLVVTKGTQFVSANLTVAPQLSQTAQLDQPAR